MWKISRNLSEMAPGDQQAELSRPVTVAEPVRKDSAKDKPCAFCIPRRFFPALKNPPLPAGTCCACQPQVARLCESRIRPPLLEKHRAVCPLQVFILVAHLGSREDPWVCRAGEQESPGATWSSSSSRLLSRTLELEGKSFSSIAASTLFAFGTLWA